MTVVGGNPNPAVKKNILAGLMVPSNTDPELRKFLGALKQHIELSHGTKGQPTERFVTVAELKTAGLVEVAELRGRAEIRNLAGRGDSALGGGRTISTTSASSTVFGTFSLTGLLQGDVLRYDELQDKFTNIPFFDPLGGDSIKFDGVMQMRARPAAHADITSYGQLWVSNSSPVSLFFTNDTGTDFLISIGSTLGDLTDVNTDGVANNDLLYRASGVWVDTAGSLQFVAGALLINNTFPSFQMNDTNASANSRRWHLQIPGDAMVWLAIDDAQSANTEWLRVNRTTHLIDTIIFRTQASGFMELRGGGGLRIVDPGDSDHITMDHDGTDAVFTGVNSIDLLLTGFQTIKLDGISGGGGAVKLAEKSSPPIHASGYGLVWVQDDSPTTLWFTDNVGGDFQLNDQGGIADGSQDDAMIRWNQLNWVESTRIRNSGASISIYEVTETNRMRFQTTLENEGILEGFGLVSYHIRPNSTEEGLVVIADGSVEQYHNNILRTATQGSGIFNLHSDTDTDSEARYFNMVHQDGTARGRIGYITSNALSIANLIDSGFIRLVANDAGSIERQILIGDPDAITTLTGDTEVRLAVGGLGELAFVALVDGEASIRHNNIAVLRTIVAASGGLEVNNTLTGAGFERVLTASDLGGTFSALSDTNDAGVANNDLLYRASGSWTDTGGELTWDGSLLHIITTQPQYNFEEVSGPADEKNWQFFANAGQLFFRVIDDAFSVNKDWLTVTRTGTVIDAINFEAGVTGAGAVNILSGTKLQVFEIAGIDFLSMRHDGADALILATGASELHLDGAAVIADGRNIATDGTKLDTIETNAKDDQTITLTGQVTGSGTGSFAASLSNTAISAQTDIGGAISTTDELLISDAGVLRRTDVSRLQGVIGITDGTEADASLRWNGSDWVENQTVRISLTGILGLESNAPTIRFLEEDAGLNEKNWWIGPTGTDELIFETRDDSLAAGITWMAVKRTGSDVDSITMRVSTGEIAILMTANANVILHHNNVQTLGTLTAAAGGAEVNNTLTGGGFERVLTLSDLGGTFTALTDTNDAGVANNDMLFRSAGVWIDTAGELTWDGSVLAINTTQPQYEFQEVSGPADEKNWQFFANAGQLFFRVIDDAFSVNKDWLTVIRTGTVVDSINFEAGVTGAGNLNLLSGTRLQVFEIAGIDFVSIRHDGTNAHILATGVSELNITGDFIKLDTVNAGLRIITDNSGPWAIALRREDQASNDALVFNAGGTNGTWAFGSNVWVRTGLQFRVYSPDSSDYLETILTNGFAQIRGVGLTSGLNVTAVSGENGITHASDGTVRLWHNNALMVETSLRTDSGAGTGLLVKDGGNILRPVGFNVMPIFENDNDDNFDLAHNGMMWHKDLGVARTYTCASDSTIPQGATWIITNEDAEDLTIADGAIILRWYDGGGATLPTGDRTLAQGGVCTVYKYVDGEYWIWGTGLT